jgi:hypothetical protein
VEFTEQQIAFALQQAESGTQVAEVCRKMGMHGRAKETCKLVESAGRCWRADYHDAINRSWVELWDGTAWRQKCKAAQSYTADAFSRMPVCNEAEPRWALPIVIPAEIQQ